MRTQFALPYRSRFASRLANVRVRFWLAYPDRIGVAQEMPIHEAA